MEIMCLLDKDIHFAQSHSLHSPLIQSYWFQENIWILFHNVHYSTLLVSTLYVVSHNVRKDLLCAKYEEAIQ